MNSMGKTPQPSVLVTGGRGFIGTYLVKQLLDERARVVSLDLKPALRDLGAEATEVEGDMRDAAILSSLFEKYRFDFIFDLASFTDVGLDEAAYKRNIEATETIMPFVLASPETRYIFYSTQFVHRVPGRLPEHDTDFHPIEPYGASKVRSEQIIREILPVEQFLILRPSYVWGAGLERFRSGLIKNLLRHTMLVPSSSKLKRSYGYVETVARQSLLLAKSQEPSPSESVFYLTDEPISLGEFCDKLKHELGSGGYVRVPPFLIRLLGAIGSLLQHFGLPAPINPVQARELTTDFPVPWERTLELTSCRTNYDSAVKKTVRWAIES